MRSGSSPVDRSEADGIDTHVRTEGTIKQEVRRQTTDGLGDFLFRSVPVGESGATDEYVGIYVDIGEQKARERRLERQNERLDEFASVVSHDLRNPLNVARGRLEHVREACDSEHLDAVERAHDRMETLIDDVLALAREGDTATDVRPVALEEVVTNCWQTVETGDATLVAETEQTIRADSGQLKQLLEDLIRNAVEHGGDGVTVTVGDLDGGFYVADDGVGISEDEREHIFEIGYSTVDEGTGFGMSIAEQVADAHGWEITVEESPAGGTQVTVGGVERDE